MIKGKIGDEKILSIWWFIILGIVGGGIVSGIFMFYNLDGDTRGLQAEIIAGRVLNCIEENNFLKKEVMNLDREGLVKFFKEKCALRESKDLYIGLSTKGFKEKNIVFGSSSMSVDCELRFDGKTKLSKYFPQCYKTERNFVYVENGERKKIVVNLIVGIKSLGGSGNLE